MTEELIREVKAYQMPCKQREMTGEEWERRWRLSIRFGKYRTI